MTKITKTEFKNTLITNKSLFFGLVRREVTEEQLNKAYIEYMNKSNKPQNFFRSAQEISRGLRFSDNSILELTGDEYTCYKSDNGKLLICKQIWVDSFDGEKYIKSMIYLIN